MSFYSVTLPGMLVLYYTWAYGMQTILMWYCCGENLSGFFPRDLPVVKISPEWVMGPEQGKSSGRIATFSLWTGMFRMAFPPFLMKQLYRCDLVVISSFVRTGYTTRRWDEACEKNSRIYLDRLQNKYTNYKGIKNNTNSGQITGIQEKLDTTCK